MDLIPLDTAQLSSADFLSASQNTDRARVDGRLFHRDAYTAPSWKQSPTLPVAGMGSHHESWHHICHLLSRPWGFRRFRSSMGFPMKDSRFVEEKLEALGDLISLFYSYAFTSRLDRILSVGLLLQESLPLLLHDAQGHFPTAA